MRKLVGMAILVIGALFLWTAFGGSVDGNAPTQRPKIDPDDAARGVGKTADVATSFFGGLAKFVDALPPQAWTVVGLFVIAGIVITIIRRNPFIVMAILAVVALGFAAGGQGSR